MLQILYDVRTSSVKVFGELKIALYGYRIILY